MASSPVSTCDAPAAFSITGTVMSSPPLPKSFPRPRKCNATTLELFYSEILDLKTNLEKFLGVSTTDDGLLEAIGVYNRSREILTGFYEAAQAGRAANHRGGNAGGAECLCRMPRQTFNTRPANSWNWKSTRTLEPGTDYGRRQRIEQHSIHRVN